MLFSCSQYSQIDECRGIYVSILLNVFWGRENHPFSTLSDLDYPQWGEKTMLKLSLSSLSTDANCCSHRCWNQFQGLRIRFRHRCWKNRIILNTTCEGNDKARDAMTKRPHVKLGIGAIRCGCWAELSIAMRLAHFSDFQHRFYCG